MAKKGVLTTSDYLNYQDYEALLSRLHQDKDYIFEMYARLGFCTACRVSDILKLKWSDIVGKTVVTVSEKKTGKTRKVRFSESVVKKFCELYVLLGSPDKNDLIFKSGRCDGQLSSQYINQQLKKMKVKYDLPIDNFSTHTFRKTFGRYVYESDNRSAESLILLKIGRAHV